MREAPGFLKGAGPRLLAAVLAAAVCRFSAAGELEVARQALRDGLWEIALAHADAAALDPTNRPAARLLALEALSAMGDDMAVLSRTQAWGTSASEDHRYRRALALERLGRRAEARAELAAPFSDAGLTALAHRLEARIAVAEGDRAAAEKAFRLASGSAVSPADRVENAVAWARYLDGLGERAKAVDVLRSENTLDAPGAAGDEARLLASEIHAALGQMDEARALWRRLAASTAMRGASRRAAFRLGFDEFESPATRTSGVARIRALVRADSEDDDAREAAIRLADRLLEFGDAAAAQDEYRRYLETNPSSVLDPKMVERRGWALLMLGRNPEAAGAFARAAQMATNAADRARCQHKQGDALAADRRFAEAAALYAQSARAARGEQALRALFAEADARERAGEGEKAVELFRAVAATPGPQRLQATLRLAARAAAEGRGEESISLYASVVTNAAAAKGELVAARLGRGRASYRAYRFEDARADFGAVAALDPARADQMRFFAALCLYGSGKDDASREEAERLHASSTDPALRADVSLWLAKWHYNHGEWAMAQNRYEEYAALHTKGDRCADALTWAARCAAAHGDDAKAVELASRAVKAAPDAPFVADTLSVQGEALMELARFAEAVLIFDRVIELTAPGEVRRRAAFRRADALYAMGADNAVRYADALKAYENLMADAELSPSERIVAAYRIGRALGKLGRDKEAEDRLYSGVVLAWRDAREKGLWLNEVAATSFSRAAFALVDRFAARNNAQAAAAVLRLVKDSGTAVAEEAARRLQKFERKGIIR